MSSNASEQLLLVSRKASSTADSPRIVWGGLAAAFAQCDNSTLLRLEQQATNVTAALRVSGPSGFSVVVAEVETVNDAASDPARLAAVVAADLQSAAGIASVAADADAWWSTYWSTSGVAVPFFFMPNLQAYWYGTQAMLAATTRGGDTMTPAPGLYGPWNTIDSSSWNGDMTLDYNYESPFFGVYSSGMGLNDGISRHPTHRLLDAYLQPLLDFRPTAQAMAQQVARQYNLSCSAAALHYPCHLAPWGLQSVDRTVYMHWNGLFAILAGINAWEYQQDAEWVTAQFYPLLDGNTQLWRCLLSKSEDGVYHDTRGDQQHEEQAVPDPQIALALIARVVSAQLDIIDALGLPSSPELADIDAHLAPYNTAPFNWESQPLSVWSAFQHASVADSDSFALYPLWPSEAVVSSRDGSLPSPATYALAQASTRAYISFDSGRSVDVFTSAVLAGQGFVFNGTGSRPENAGSVVQSGPFAPAYAISPWELVTGLGLQFNKYLGRNMLMRAPGGGVENIGVQRAINEMLVTSRGGRKGAIQLFPFWPAGISASFAWLAVKGGVAVAATYANVTRTVGGVFTRVDYPLDKSGTPAVVRMMDPWGGGPNSVNVTCGSAGAPVAVAWEGGGVVFSFSAPTLGDAAQRTCAVRPTEAG